MYSQIHSVEFPKGSTCQLTDKKPPHTQFAGPVEAFAEVQRGGPLQLRVFVPLSRALLPSDDGPIVCNSSGPAPFRPTDKDPFHKGKAREEGGEGWRKGRKAVMGAWKGKGDGRKNTLEKRGIFRCSTKKKLEKK